MNNDTVIRADNVSKKFCKSLKGSMAYGLIDVGRNILGLSCHSERLRRAEFWAVKDVSFEVKRAEALGIIGHNGSGKTTFLKMLNGIFWPDKGKITVKGRVGALIAVGAGFHPMFTGRENIYINGAILGMGRHEIKRKFDSIVEFAGIKDFIDTPVNYYSSGMFVRLGFAIAVHCQPDILLVDEVLAVGDMPFQGRCLERISQLRREGCTVILISHNEELVRRTCDWGILLNKGEVVFQGDLNMCYARYHEFPQEGWIGEVNRAGNRRVEIRNVEFLDVSGKPQNTFRIGQPMKVQVQIVLNETVEVDGLALDINFNSLLGYVACSTHSEYTDHKLGQFNRSYVAEIFFPKLQLAPGNYRISGVLSSLDLLEIYDWQRNMWNVSIEGDGTGLARGAVWMPVEYQWRT